MEEARGALLALPVPGQNRLHVRDAQLLLGFDRVREGFLVFRFLPHQHFPSRLGAVLVPVRRAARDRLIAFAEGEVGGVARLRGLVLPGLHGVLDQIGRHDDVLRVDVDLVQREGVRDVGDFVVLHLAGDVAVAFEEHDLPGFVAVRHRVGATARGVAVLRHESDRDVDGFAGGLRALGHQAADPVADAAVDHRVLLFEGLVAVVRDDGDAVLVDEAVRERIPGRVQRLRPVVAVGVRDLRDLRGRGFVRDHLARLVVGRRHPILAHDDAKVVVFVVPDDDLARRRDVLSDHHGRAGRGVDRHPGDRRRHGRHQHLMSELHVSPPLGSGDRLVGPVRLISSHARKSAAPGQLGFGPSAGRRGARLQAAYAFPTIAALGTKSSFSASQTQRFPSCMS